MGLSIFCDKTKSPQEADLSSVLGDTFVLWNQLKNDISKHFCPITAEWGFSSPKTGWGLRLKHEKRAVLYMVPCKGYFLASFALGEKAVAAAHESDLPASVLEVIETASKYAEGRGVRLEVRTTNDVAAVEKVAKIKMMN
jgi:Protein of unknown function (DUF3788)